MHKNSSRGLMYEKKIVRVISRLNIGGPAIHTILLSSALNRDGYKDILVCGEPSESEGDMYYLAKREHVEPFIIPSLKRDISIAQDIKAFIKLYSIIKKERPYIVHTHTAKAGALGRLAAVLAGAPIKIHTFHGHIFDGYFSLLKAKIFLIIERFLAFFTDKVITISEGMRDEIVNKLKVVVKSKSVVIPLGLDLDMFLGCDNYRGNFRRKLGLNDEILLVGIVGRLVPIKNHKMFLNVARKVIDGNPNLKVKFLVIGDGEFRDKLKIYASELGLRDNVIFTGWVEDLVQTYADLDIVALTSLNEGTPVSLIEAMASGKAVIATSVGGVKDMLKDGIDGLLVNPFGTEDFCTKLISLLKDKEMRRNLGINARREVFAKHSRDRMVRDIESLYEELWHKNRLRKVI